MRIKLLQNGMMRVQGSSGTYEIAPGHPDFPCLREQHQRSACLNVRLFGLLMVVLGLAGWWYNWHLAQTTGEYYIKLCIMGPLGLFGGLLMLVRPDWSGPWRSDGKRAYKSTLITVMTLVMVISGIDFYLLNRPTSSRSRVVSRPSFAPRTSFEPEPSFSTQSPIAPSSAELSISSTSVAPTVVFLSQTYRLGSFNQKVNPMWEFITADENMDDWKTMLTIVDRPDARTPEDLDRLAEGLMQGYKSRGARILASRTMRAHSAKVFNYLVVAFEESGKQRIELDFVKMALAPKNAAVLIYGVRIADQRDCRAKAKEYLDRNAEEVGRALDDLVPPDISKLPRQDPTPGPTGTRAAF